jgi:hypothetical protein
VVPAGIVAAMLIFGIVVTAWPSNSSAPNFAAPIPWRPGPMHEKGGVRWHVAVIDMGRSRADLVAFGRYLLALNDGDHFLVMDVNQHVVAMVHRDARGNYIEGPEGGGGREAL